MKKIMKRSDSNRGITPRNLSVALLLSLAIIGAGCEQSQAAGSHVILSESEESHSTLCPPLAGGQKSEISRGGLTQERVGEVTNLREGTLPETGEGSIQIDTQTVNQVKKSLASGKKSNKFFKLLSDKVSNNTPLPTGTTSHAILSESEESHSTLCPPLAGDRNLRFRGGD